MSDGAIGDGAVHGGRGGIAGSSSLSGVPNDPRQGLIVILVCGVVPVALLAAIVAVPAALWSRLPALLAGPLLLAGFAGYALRRYGGLGAAGSETGRLSLGLRPARGNNVETPHPVETSHAYSVFYFRRTKSFHVNDGQGLDGRAATRREARKGTMSPLS